MTTLISKKSGVEITLSWDIISIYVGEKTWSLDFFFICRRKNLELGKFSQKKKEKIHPYYTVC